MKPISRNYFVLMSNKENEQILAIVTTTYFAARNNLTSGDGKRRWNFRKKRKPFSGGGNVSTGVIGVNSGSGGGVVAGGLGLGVGEIVLIDGEGSGNGRGGGGDGTGNNTGDRNNRRRRCVLHQMSTSAFCCLCSAPNYL